MAKLSLTYLIATLAGILALLPAQLRAETRQIAVSIGFPVNQTDIRPGFGDNAAQLAQLEGFLGEIDPDDIDVIRIDGYASPEGPYANNMRLARGRAQALVDYIAARTPIPAEKLAVGESLLSWEALRPLVAESRMKGADTVLALIDVAIADRSEAAQLDVLGRLQALDGGAAWRQLKRSYFPQLRLSKLDIEVTIAEPVTQQPPEEVIPEPLPADTVPAQPEPIEQPEPEIIAQPEPEEPEPLPSHLYLKTNGIGWAMLVTNLAVEYDFAPHWSAALPVYYSGFNEHWHKWKFRTVTIQPEARYWLRHGENGNHGLYVGAHLGLGWFNFATGGRYRTQDHDGNTPAIGGGLSVGYRVHLARRWSLEFSVGAGVYDAHYDKFENHHNGPKVVDNRHRTWLGIDQASVSIVYAFPIKKGGSK